MYFTIEPRLITLLNVDPSDSLGSYPHLDLPPLQDPNILKASGRPTTLEPTASRSNKQSPSGSQSKVLGYDGDSPGVHVEPRTESSRKASGNPSVTDNCMGGSSAQSLRKILSDDSEITHTSTSRKRQRLENRGGDFVQLPQPSRKQKAVKRVVPPIIIGLHEPPPNQAALFPPIASSSFHDSHGRNTLNTSANEAKEEIPTELQANRPKSPNSIHDNKSTTSKKVGVRARKKWTDEETRNLILGVQKHGIGNWKRISDDKELQFNDRTPVHIKDRFRTCFPGAFRGQNDTVMGPFANVSRKLSDPSRSHSDPAYTTVREDDSSDSSDDSIANEKLKCPQVKPAKKTRAHRKYFEDLVEQGVVQAFPKSTRRERRMFTEEEDKNIKKGVETYGQSSWTLIQRDPRFGLESRKPTDIRDRFRNRFRDKCFGEEDGEKLKYPTSAVALYETQPPNGNMSLPTQEISLQERMLGSVQSFPDFGVFKQALEPPPFTFRGSFTELLGPLPVTDTADAFSFPPSFDWQDNTAHFSSTIGEMDISRVLLDDNWPSDPNSHLKQKQNVTDISSICSATPLSLPQLMSNYNVSGM